MNMGKKEYKSSKNNNGSLMCYFKNCINFYAIVKEIPTEAEKNIIICNTI